MLVQFQLPLAEVFGTSLDSIEMKYKIATFLVNFNWRVETKNFLGMYTHAAHMTLFCTVNRSEVKPRFSELRSLRAVALAADPTAFIVIGQGHQTNGGIVKAKTIAPPTSRGFRHFARKGEQET